MINERWIKRLAAFELRCFNIHRFILYLDKSPVNVDIFVHNWVKTGIRDDSGNSLNFFEDSTRNE
jgi:hypothetical protein